MGVLLMLMSIGGLVVAAGLIVVSIVSKRLRLATFTLGGVLAGFAFYTAALFAASLMSTEKTLAANEAKEFCGFYLDCHVHVRVIDVQVSKRIFSHKADGKFYVVTAEVYSDARNPNIRFRLLDPEAVIFDSAGNKFTRNDSVEMDMASGPMRFGADITGHEPFKKELVFDIPETSTGLRMLVTEGYGVDKKIESVLIGDEDSIMHKQTFFEITDMHPGTDAHFGAPLQFVPIIQEQIVHTGVK